MAKGIDIEQINEKEFRIKDNKIFLLEDHIIYIEAYGEQTDEIAITHLNHNRILVKQFSGKINYLINLNDAGKSFPKARRIWLELSEAETTNKTALFGMHPVAKLLASFVIGVTKRKNMRFYHSRVEAVNWLKT